MPDESIVEGGSLISSRITRRNLIKTGAIVGGVAWAAPVIDSFASPASAGSSSAGCYVCFSTGGVPFYAGEDNPGPAEAISSCTAEGLKVPSGDGGPYTSGTYVLFNTSDPKGAFGSFAPVGFNGAYCTYGTTNATQLNNSCPATFAVSGGTGNLALVSCQTGTW